MSKLGKALRAKFKSPVEALAALGLDGSLLAMDAVTHDPKTGQFAAGEGASPSTRGEHKQQSEWHKGQSERHFNQMHEHMRTGNLKGQRESRAKYIEHKKAAESHGIKAREEMVPTGTGRSMPKSQVSKTTRSLLGWSKDHAITGDSKENHMTTTKLSPRAVSTRGALYAYLKPRLAVDAKLDLNAILAGVNAANFTARKPFIASAVRSAASGNLAQDADVEDVGEILDQIEELAAEAGEAVEGTGAEGGGPDPDSDNDAGASLPEEDDGSNHVAEFLKDKLSPEDLATVIKMMGHGEREAGEQTMDESEEDMMKRSAADARARLGRDESPEERAKREAEDKRAWDAKHAKDAEPVTREAMDAAIKAAVAGAQTKAISNQRAIREAERFVRPWVGDIAMDAASPAEVYRTALKALNVGGLDKVHPDAYRPILEAQPRPGERPARGMAADALPGGTKSFAERFPNASRVEHV